MAGATFEDVVIIDTTDTEAFLVRKNGDGGDVFAIDTTNSQVDIGPGTSNHSTMLSLYGTVTSETLGPHITATTTEDAYPVFQQLNYSHDNISLLFDSYWDSSTFKSSDPGSNFRIAKFTDALQFTFDSGIVAGAAVTFETGFSMGNTGNISIPTTTKIATTSNPSNSAGGALNVNGDLVLAGTTPRIYFPDSTNAIPTFTNRSGGTRIVLFPNIGATSVDYAIGIGSSGVLWNSVTTTAESFKWYGGVTEAMTLTGTGNLILAGTVDGVDIAAQDLKLEALYTTIGLSALTSGEVDQLENIGATTISATQWGYLGATDQALATTDAVQFNSAIIDSTGTEALLVRKDADGGDVFTVDTTNSKVTITGDLEGLDSAPSITVSSSNLVNVTAAGNVTVRNTKMVKMGADRTLFATFEITPVAGTLTTEFRFSVPELTTVTNKYDIIASIQGWLDSNDTNLENLNCFAIPATNNGRIKFTSVNTTAHLVQVVMKYTSN